VRPVIRTRSISIVESSLAKHTLALSRGLEEAMLAFIGQARAPGYGLRASVYEFSYEPAIAAFGAAQKKCKDVQIVYDARVPTAAKKGGAARQRIAEVKKLLKQHGLSDVSTPRTEGPSFISHNKFIVLLERGKAQAVWTGSTNFTESGIFGQSNVGHVVRDPVIAEAYLEHWKRLQADPAEEDIRSENESADPGIEAYPPGFGHHSGFQPAAGPQYAELVRRRDEARPETDVLYGGFWD